MKLAYLGDVSFGFYLAVNQLITDKTQTQGEYDWFEFREFLLLNLAVNKLITDKTQTYLLAEKKINGR